jgi:TonB family protein
MKGSYGVRSIVGGDRSPRESPESSLFSPIPAGWFSLPWFAVSSGFHLILLFLLIAFPFWQLHKHPGPPVVFVNPQLAEPLIEPAEAPAGPEMEAPPISRQPKNEMYWSAEKTPGMVRERVVLENAGKKDSAAPAEIETASRPANPPPPVTNTPSEALKPAVITGVFAGDSAAVPVNRPAREVKTGAFGSPQGIARATLNSVDPAPSMGTFDASAGPGRGNGSEGNTGLQGKVASAGFGNGIAGNGDADSMTPVEILFKPKPIYTQEARDLKVQGEVLVEVLFTASGEVQVLQLVRSLGHGLDESGLRAVQMIRFKPARRDGKPIDCRTVVHIIFDLV